MRSGVPLSPLEGTIGGGLAAQALNALVESLIEKARLSLLFKREQ